MKFVIDNNRKPIEGILRYLAEEHSFQTDTSEKIDGVASLLINDLNLELNDEGQVCYVWGLCPHTAWGQTEKTPGDVKVGSLGTTEFELIPGASKRINRERWPISLNRNKGWICIGDVNAQGTALMFAPGAVAVIEMGQIKSLWLQPIEIPGHE